MAWYLTSFNGYSFQQQFENGNGNQVGTFLQQRPGVDTGGGFLWTGQLLDGRYAVPTKEKRTLTYEELYINNSSLGTGWRDGIAPYVRRYGQLFRYWVDEPSVGGEDPEFINAYLPQLPFMKRGMGGQQVVRYQFETTDHAWKGTAINETGTATAGANTTVDLSGSTGTTVNDDLTITLEANGTISRVEIMGGTSSGGAPAETFFHLYYDRALTSGQSVIINCKSKSVIFDNGSAQTPDYDNLSFDQSRLVSGTVYSMTQPLWGYISPLASDIIIYAVGASIDYTITGYTHYA